MCLAIPSKIESISDNSVAVVDVEGVKRETSLLLIDDAKIGDYVIVHAGFAIQKIDEETAQATLADMRAMVAMVEDAEKANRG